MNSAKKITNQLNFFFHSFSFTLRILQNVISQNVIVFEMRKNRKRKYSCCHSSETQKWMCQTGAAAAAAFAVLLCKWVYLFVCVCMCVPHVFKISTWLLYYILSHTLFSLIELASHTRCCFFCVQVRRHSTLKFPI